MKQNEDILSELKLTGVDKLAPMVASGQTSMLLEEGRKITGVLSAALVNIPEEKAWRVLLDYDKYRTFLPGINTSKVLSRTENEVVVKFEAGLNVMGVGGMFKYTYRFIIEKPYVYVFDTGKGEMSGYWALLPAPDDGKVILVHADVAKDVKSIHIFLRFLVERLPPAEVGLHLSPVVMLVNRMKQHMEQCR